MHPPLSDGVVRCSCHVALILWLRRHLPLPPGPKTSIFGSVELPRAYPWKVYADWRRLYGDLIYIRKFGNPILVLNSARVVHDLLDKRSAIYSSRPQRTMIYIMGWKWLFSTLPYSSWWKRHRTLFYEYFSINTTPRYHHVLLQETHVLLQNLANTPDDLFHHVRRTAAAIVMMNIYGHRVAPEGDVFVTLADNALGTLARCGIFGTYLVDYIPLLRHVPTWLPGAEFKRKALEWRKLSLGMLNKPFEMVKERVSRGTAVPCFTAAELEKWLQSGQDSEHEALIRDVAATAYAASQTVSAILSFFLAITAYPEVLKRSQAEVDRVVGTDRLPSFDDRHALPYIDWVVWECLRWNPVTPLGIAHSTTEDDVYESYRIPAGTTVLPNVWGILHDPATYPDPLTFNPDRYANAKQNADLGINEPPTAAFGFGRRICPGRWLATDAVWIAVATVAAAFDVSKATDEKGLPVEPEVQFTSTLLSRPNPFKCRITPRSQAAAMLIEQTISNSSQ
ncbi:cytochrome P450 [Wolfiporia cocos MD-104 SS10]|uniref:Cytochrome P450 n=1 Tax=Wolfiporia cocos (strain MD-104) TaxID=742152 RepID=A0A2H3IUV1_WOLCO|nr:cytochrome P450 [Wolfiporia cocos MD-104 SS10]